MNINDKEIGKKISDEIKKYEKLKNSFLKIRDSEEKASKSRLENFEKLKDIKEQDNDLLSELYQKFTTEMKILEDKKRQHISKITDLILPITVYYPEKLKETKTKLEDLNKLKKENNSLQKEHDKTQDKDVAQEVNKKMINNKQVAVQKGESIEHELCKFEADRVNDNKYLFLHYIHSELKYHAAMVEKLSTLFKDINGIDPRAELPNFIKKYNLKVDLHKIDNNIDQILSNREKKEREEQQKRNDVYDSELHNNNSENHYQGMGVSTSIKPNDYS